ncbi:MAG: RraA family protein [Burkholderiales bacterium]|nr:RraA family protein [Burkholderiales bacterium]
MIEDAPQLQTQPIIRPDSKLVEQLRGTPTGFLVDAMGGSGALDFRIKPAVLEQYAFCGVALTCHAGPADNLALVHALQYVEPGDVLMVATDSFTGCAVTGDLVLGMAKNSGAVGFVTDGCVRDLVGLKSVGLPAWSLGVTPNSPHRNGPGTIGFPVNIAGYPVRSGDVVVADQDGVVIIPIEKISMVLEKLPAIRKAEGSADESVRQGARLQGFLKK